MQPIRKLTGLISTLYALIIPTITAGGSGDGDEVNGVSIDREDAHCARFSVAARAALGAGESLVVQATVQDSADGSTFADVAADLQPGGAADSTILTLTSAGGGTVTGEATIDVDLSSLRRYVRIQLHPDASRANTDTYTVAAVCELGGLVIEG